MNAADNPAAFKIIIVYYQYYLYSAEKGNYGQNKIQKTSYLLRYDVFSYLYVASASLLYRIAGKTDAELLEDLLINIREHDGAVNLAAAELWKLCKRLATVLIVL